MYRALQTPFFSSALPNLIIYGDSFFLKIQSSCLHELKICVIYSTLIRCNDVHGSGLTSSIFRLYTTKTLSMTSRGWITLWESSIYLSIRWNSFICNNILFSATTCNAGGSAPPYSKRLISTPYRQEGGFHCGKAQFICRFARTASFVEATFHQHIDQAMVQYAV